MTNVALGLLLLVIPILTWETHSPLSCKVVLHIKECRELEFASSCTWDGLLLLAEEETNASSNQDR